MKSLLVALLLISVNAKAKGRHELGLFSGPFLISHATENMAALGGRASLALNSNHIKHLEFRGFTSGTETGKSYYLGEIGLRNEFEIGRLSAVWLLGFDWYYFRNSETSPFLNKSGWHSGVGINVEVSNNLMFRNDYIVRFANGMSLLVTLGFSWAFGDSTGSTSNSGGKSAAKP